MATASETSRSGGRRIDVDGAVDALRRSLGVLRDVPGVVVLMVVVAPLDAYLGSAGNIIGFVAQAGAVAFLAASLPSVTDPKRRTDNSLPVRMLVLFVTGLLAAIAFLFGLLAVVVPGLYLLVRFYLITPAVILDDHGPANALAVSWERTSGNVLTVAGVMVAVLGVGLLAGVGAILLAAGGVDAATQRAAQGDIQLAGAVTSAVSGPLAVAAMVVLYEGLAE